MLRKVVPVLLTFGCLLSLIQLQAQENSSPTLLATLQDENINELSGLAASRKYPGHYWAHNDSGDSARLFLINGGGKTVATVNLEGIEARDWEDMTVAGNWIYVGDIGDNFSVMENLKIHRLREPELNPRNLGQQITLRGTQIESMTLRYPDGARDAETLAATPDGRLLIVSKSTSGSNFYALSQPFQNRTSGALTKIGSFAFGATGWLTKLTTGGDLSKDGRKLVVTTYSQVYEFPLAAPFDWRSLQLQKPAVQTLPSLKQCESVCYSVDGKTIVVSSEGKNAPLHGLNSKISSR